MEVWGRPGRREWSRTRELACVERGSARDLSRAVREAWEPVMTVCEAVGIASGMAASWLRFGG